LASERRELPRTRRVAPSPQPEEPRFRGLLEAAPDAIVEVDGEGRIVLLNGMTETLFGYGPDELSGQPLEILLPEELRASHMHNLVAYRARPAIRPMGSGLALRGRRKDGSCFPVEISLRPFQSGEAVSVIAIIRDIRERKQAEADLRAIQELLTSELQSRSSEVERADRLKSEFLSSMSHELRTPLHTIIGFADSLAEELNGPLNEDQKRFIGHIQRDATHLLELIDQILDLSKIEADRPELQVRILNVSEAIEEVLLSIRLLSQAKSIQIEASLDADAAIEADHLRFKQILFNLLSNAVKFSPVGGMVRVDAVRNGGFVEISVSDNGPGIPREEQAAVFDKFHQVGAVDKGVREGTGLGLPITRALVEQHGGHIWLESEPGKGSRFTFTIPERVEASEAA
jgi:PAS domain S-box-containing protein